jgi:peroxiredoxin
LARLDIGDRMKPFNLPGVDGKKYLLTDYEDRAAVVVVFTCNHCPYARAWEDRLIQLQSEYGDRGVQLLGINANDANKYPDDSFPKMQERAEEKGFNFPYLHDELQEVAREYGAQRTPEVFLFDGEGRLRYHGTVDDNYEDSDAVKEAYLREAIEAVLEGREPATPRTEPVGCTIKWK